MNVVSIVGGGRPGAAGGFGGVAASAAPERPSVSLSMYYEPPLEEVTLEDFEVLAFERLKVLKKLEDAKSRGMKGRELSKTLAEAWKAYMGAGSEEERRRKDTVSHHILRLAYCNSDDNRRWFLQYETALFRWRAESESKEGIADFMAKHDIHFTPVGPHERDAVVPFLKQIWDASYSASEEGASFVIEDVFKVPFLQALDLVRSRSVFLRGGFAYVPRDKLVSILTGKYRAYLNAELVYANRFLPTVQRDERVTPLLENMHAVYTGPKYGAGHSSVDNVTAATVDELATATFPLCMAAMHASLKERHKLKHLGRLQYGLFLKGLGLPYEEALVFWQREFTKSMSAEEFIKKYRYNIGHSYGKEGKRQNYDPYSCKKMVEAPPPGGEEVHGCPYRNWDFAAIRGTLGRMGLTPTQTDDVLESVRERNYTIACRKQYEARFPGADSGSVGSHPNGYAESAHRYVKAKRDGGAVGGAGSGAAAGSFAAASTATPAAAAAGAGATGAGGAAAGSGAKGGTAAMELAYD